MRSPSRPDPRRPDPRDPVAGGPAAGRPGRGPATGRTPRHRVASDMDRTSPEGGRGTGRTGGSGSGRSSRPSLRRRASGSRPALHGLGLRRHPPGGLARLLIRLDPARPPAMVRATEGLRRRDGAGVPPGPPTPADPRRRWNALAQEARDACYDNTLREVADSAAQVAARNAASAAYRCRASGGPRRAYGPGSPQRPSTSTRPGTGRRPAWSSSMAATGSAARRGAVRLLRAGPERRRLVGGEMVGYTLGAGGEPHPDRGGDRRGPRLARRPRAAHGIRGPLILSAGRRRLLTALHLGHPAVAAGLAISGVYDLAPIRPNRAGRQAEPHRRGGRDPVPPAPSAVAKAALQSPTARANCRR